MNELNATSKSMRPYKLLLLEPHFVTRRTVVSVARSFERLEVRESSGIESAEQLLEFTPFDGFVIALGEQLEGLGLISRIRAGQTSSDVNAAVAVTAEGCDVETIQKLRELAVRRVMLKPFKVKTILETISAFSAELSLR